MTAERLGKHMCLLVGFGANRVSFLSCVQCVSELLIVIAPFVFINV